MIIKADYEYYKKEYDERKAEGMYFSLNNRKLANDFFIKLQEDLPGLRMIYLGSTQFIFEDGETQESLSVFLKHLREERKKELDELDEKIKVVSRPGGMSA